jgi:hypothetical protein
MTNRAGQPSRVFNPGLSILLPDGWIARASVELVAPDVQTVITATLEDTAADTVLEEYADAHGAMLAEQVEGYEQMSCKIVALPEDRRALVRRFAWTPEGLSRTEQVQLYVVENGRGLVATAIAEDTDLDGLERRLRDLAAGIQFVGSAPRGGLTRVVDDPRSRTYAAFERGELATTLERALGREGVERPGSEAWRSPREAWEQAARS